MTAAMDAIRDAAAGLTPHEWEAVRGRIILSWLSGSCGVRTATLNDRPFADKVDPASIREGISGLTSAGPEYILRED